MAGIRRSANRPKVAKHLRSQSSKTFVNRTKEDRDRDHAATDAWAAREREKDDKRQADAVAARQQADAEIAERQKKEVA